MNENPHDLIWRSMDGGNRAASIRMCPGITLFIATPQDDGWLLFGAFVPDGAEPVECDTLEEVEARASQLWKSFRGMVMERCR